MMIARQIGDENIVDDYFIEINGRIENEGNV